MKLLSRFLDAFRLCAMHDVKFIRELFLETAMAPFKSKILPILTYGIEVIWIHLNERNLANQHTSKERSGWRRTQDLD